MWASFVEIGDLMLIGIVGAPNKGKSTLFSALTLKDAEIADYPFTTIKPNIGIAYATKPCPETELHVKCKARNSLCDGGIRKIPVNIVDVAGLVEGAHGGKGMGNQFLSDLAASDALILVVDGSGKTDPQGNPCNGCNPSGDCTMVWNELVQWVSSIIERHSEKIAKRMDGIDAIYEALAGLKVTREQIKSSAERCGLSLAKPKWSGDERRAFSDSLLRASKPVAIAVNKSDIKGFNPNMAYLTGIFDTDNVVPISAAIELALRKAAESGIVDYTAGAREFKITRDPDNEAQLHALDFMSKFVREKGTNVQELMNMAVFGIFDNIVVYPVEDETKYADHFGNVLPDAIMLKRGSTAAQLAEAIHTDIAKSMLYAVDARTKMRIGKDHVLKDGDVVKIVSAAR